MSAKSTALQVLNTRAGMAAVGVAAVAIVLYVAARKAADIVVTKTPNLYAPEKKDRLLFGFINIDEPFALTKRVGCSLPFVNCGEAKKSVTGWGDVKPPGDYQLLTDTTAQTVRDASVVGSIH